MVVDLPAGADGGWSKVRQMLSPAVPTYCGVTLVELQLIAANPHHDAAAALVGTGSMFALSDGKAVLSHGGNLIWVGAGLQVPQDWAHTGGVDWADPTAARAALLREFADWSPALTHLFRFCDDGVIPRPIFALPVGHSWARTPGVTLVGDAAHPMTPFAGEGANLAMLDGVELAMALLQPALATGARRVLHRDAGRLTGTASRNGRPSPNLAATRSISTPAGSGRGTGRWPATS